MITFSERSVSINKLEIFFKQSVNQDSGESIIFIHGLGCSGDTFRDIGNYSCFSSASLYIIDLPGYGNSRKDTEFSYSMTDQAAILDGFIKILPESKINIAAHSMGAAIALLFNEETMKRVKSFANIEGNLISEDCGIFSRGIVSHKPEEYSQKIFPAQAKTFLTHEQFRLGKTTADIMYKSALSLVSWSDSGDLLNKFKALDCRKAYFFGEQNSGMPILPLIEDIKRIMIPGSGHGMMTENPDAFYPALFEFIFPTRL